jgi:hypothetical protein
MSDYAGPFKLASLTWVAASVTAGIAVIVLFGWVL